MARRSRLARPVSTSQSAAAWKSSKTFCLRAAPPGVVPGLAVLEPAAQAGDGVDAAGRAPGGDLRRPDRGLGDGEPAVAVEDGGRVGPGTTSSRWIRNIPIEVPSSDGYSTWLTSIDGTAPSSTAAGNHARPWRRRTRSRPSSARRTSRRRRTPARSPGRRPSPATATTIAEPVDDAVRRAVGGVAAHGVDGVLRRHDPHLVARARSGWESTAAPSATSVSHVVGSVASERHTHEAAARRLERRDADERLAVGGELERRSSPRRRRSPCVHSSRRADRGGGRRSGLQPTSTCTSSHRPSGESATSGHACGSGWSAQTTGSSRQSSPSRWWWTVRWYWSPCGIAGVEEARAVGLPRHAAGPRVRGSPRRGRGRPRRRRPAARSPRCHPRSSRRRRGGRRRRPRTSRWRWPRRTLPSAGSTSTTGAISGIDGGATRQHELLGTGRALEGEELIAADLHGHRDGQLQQRRAGARATHARCGVSRMLRV